MMDKWPVVEHLGVRLLIFIDHYVALNCSRRAPGYFTYSVLMHTIDLRWRVH